MERRTKGWHDGGCLLKASMDDCIITILHLVRQSYLMLRSSKKGKTITIDGEMNVFIY